MQPVIRNSRATTLPAEVLRYVFEPLSPRDFNAARHTCRQWMHGSLDATLLVLMLKRGGWWSEIDNEHDHRTLDVWSLSCRLATECALSTGWTGNGLDNGYSEALVQTTVVDFSDLAAGDPHIGQQSGGLILTASVCGKYLLAAVGILIYVYELGKDNLHPFTCVICPSRVLATAMDTTARRLSVAALLDNREGIICNLKAKHGTRCPDTEEEALLEGPSAKSRHPHCSAFTTHLYPANNPSSLSTSGSSQQSLLSRMTEQPKRSPEPTADRQQTASGRRSYSGSIPVEAGPHSIHRHLCSADDPPRSVAICPQRQCVAYGCAAGLELHWVDALTGQNLNRWFPLTGPSDHLYFLPPRRGVDSVRTLRLISSAAHPDHRTVIASRVFARKVNPISPGIRSFTGTIGVAGLNIVASTHSSRQRIQLDSLTTFTGDFIADCDHFRAVPLPDGFHIMFTDPDTSFLCIGSDAPLGDSRRLLRKIFLIPPAGQELENVGPRLYQPFMCSSGGGQKRGRTVRIVAVYEDTLVVFSLPIAVLELSRREQQTVGPTSLPQSSSSAVQATDWLRWWPKEYMPDQFPPTPRLGVDPPVIWPLFVSGCIIGRLSHIVDVSINEDNGLAIWAFAQDGIAAAWAIRQDRNYRKPIHRIVQADGILQGETTGSATTVYTQDRGDSPDLETASRPGSIANSTVHIGGHGTWYDEDGEVIMMDAPIEVHGTMDWAFPGLHQL